jgi:hypothetical protein
MDETTVCLRRVSVGDLRRGGPSTGKSENSLKEGSGN